MPLDRLQSVPELIIAVAGLCAPPRHASTALLHRVSQQQLSFPAYDGGTVKGMLIDLTMRSTARSGPMRTAIGTLNFMSVNNLEGNSNKRELDDWEALIYVLVWLGTFGLNGTPKHDSDAVAQKDCRC
ncbi:hypothetical protein BX661DRAFT_208790 [Kickxella alabastrina]|uniref:uncharacterized protein n=1 Tax=Kickxella alabastrina TaxID=61397 RepID=UPI00221E9280|nr:uncharacterized protein BX661DRAFT_208790 [Kickxella alabastrina]KAI7817422.1 hypothetical protein BX661DRAFT_208790 [Kickxella alabastrina]